VPTLEQVLKNNPDKVKVVFKNFPLRSHKYAATAATAALAADAQGKFWAFHDQLFINYNRLNDQKITDIARDLGFNASEFEKQMQDSKVLSAIGQDIRDGTQAGVHGTPAVFINGRRLRDKTFRGFQVLIHKELEKIKKTAQSPKPGAD